MSNNPPSGPGPSSSGSPYAPDSFRGGPSGYHNNPTQPLPPYQGTNPTQPLPPYQGTNPTQPLPPYQGSNPTQPLPPHQGGTGYGQSGYGPRPTQAPGQPGYGQAAYGGQGPLPPTGGPGHPGGKKGLPWWLWVIIGLLVVGLLAGIFFAATNAMKPAADSTPLQSAPSSAPVGPTSGPTSIPSRTTPSATQSSSKPSPSKTSATPSGPQSLKDVDALATQAGMTCSQWTPQAYGDMEGQSCVGGKDVGTAELYSPTFPLDNAFWTGVGTSTETETPIAIYVVTDKNHWAITSVYNRSALDKISAQTGAKVYKVTSSGLQQA